MEDKLSKEERKEVKKEIKKAIHEDVISKAASIRNEYKKQVSTAVLTALGLVIALVWKDFITALMPSITAPGLLANYPVIAQLYTASIITIIAVIGIVVISHWMKPKEN